MIGVTVANFNLITPTPSPTATMVSPTATATTGARQGSLSYYLDPASRTTGTSAAAVVRSGSSEYTWPNVSSGTHQFGVELMGTNGQALAIPVVLFVTVVIP